MIDYALVHWIPSYCGHSNYFSQKGRGLYIKWPFAFSRWCLMA